MGPAYILDQHLKWNTLFEPSENSDIGHVYAALKMKTQRMGAYFHMESFQSIYVLSITSGDSNDCSPDNKACQQPNVLIFGAQYMAVSASSRMF